LELRENNELYTIYLSIIADLFAAKIAGYTFMWTTYETETSTYLKTVNTINCIEILDSTQNLTTFRETYSGVFYIIFFFYYSRFVCCKDHGLNFYGHFIQNRNVDLPTDNEYNKLALKSRCTPLDSTKNLTIFRETYSGVFYFIFFVYCSIFVCCKDRGLNFYRHFTQDRNVDLPIDSKCNKFTFKSRCTIPRFN